MFFSFNYFQPTIPELIYLPNSSYSYKTQNINANNHWSKFKELKNSNFFIHPGEINSSVVLFKFKDTQKLVMDFSLNRVATGGDINFTIKIDSHIKKRFNITKEKKEHITLNIYKKSTLIIIANKNGSTFQDWGNIQIFTPNKSFFDNNMLIPLLWSIFFIILWYTRYYYLAINNYMILLTVIASEKMNFTLLYISSIYTSTLLLFILTIFMIFIYKIFSKRTAFIINLLISFSIYIVPLLMLVYSLNFETKITSDIMFAVFQSNSGEAYDYITNFIHTKYILFTLLFILSSTTLLYLQKKAVNITTPILILLLTTIIFNISFNKILSLRIPNFIGDNIEKYNHELEMFKKVQEKREAGEIEFKATKEESGETYIVVIGESLNKNHMGLYGYHRDTTPNLSKMYRNHKIIKFDNIYSNHTHTMKVLSLALTEANQYNKKDYYKSLSIIDVLNRANIETYWLSNQNMLGGWDNLVSVMAHSANHITSINTSIGYTITAQKYDGELIQKVAKILSQKSEKNRVIFVHLMGNHTTYYTRYPNRYKRYKRNNYIDQYDNSVLYNDYVVSSILKELQKQKGITGFIYMPDHADDVEKNLGHSSAHFTIEMTQIPMIISFNQSYKKRYSNRYQTLLKNRYRLFSNDLFYDTLIGIFDIKTNRYSRKYDLSSNNYQLKEEDALMLHGKYHYNKKFNFLQ